MATLIRWLNNPYVLATLLLAGATNDLILIGFACDLSKSDWGTWVGSIGTVATLFGTIWLATSEQRRRVNAERSLALVTVAGLSFRISIVKLHLDAVGQRLLSDMTAGRPTDYAYVSSLFSQLPIWKPEELVPVVGIRHHLAARLAFAAAEIDGMRTAFEMTTSVPLYKDPNISRMFNATTLPRINATIEGLIDCLARCRTYMDETGFSDQSPMAEP